MTNWVADPDWGGWIVAYFYLGGIAAGSYFLAVLMEWFGGTEDRALAKIAYRIALPLIAICGLLLVVDLFRPERFWHMLLKSEVVNLALAKGFPLSADGWRLAAQSIMFKPWSPMSLGSWGLTIFGACTFLSFLATLGPKRIPGRWFHQGWASRILQVIGCVSGFFVASYTGSLLTATSLPVWSDTMWLGALFLASAVSTSIAAMTLIAMWRQSASEQSRGKLATLEPIALATELVVIGIFFASLFNDWGEIFTSWPTVLLWLAVIAVGIVIPFTLRAWIGERRRWTLATAATCVLLGGLFLRFTVLTMPFVVEHDDLDRGTAAAVRISPEDGRLRGGGPGADIGNRRADVTPRSKLPVSP